MGNYLDSVIDVLDARKLIKIYASEDDSKPIFSGRVFEVYTSGLLTGGYRVKNFKVCMSTVEIVIG